MKRNSALLLCGIVAASSIMASESRAQKPDAIARQTSGAVLIAHVDALRLLPTAPNARAFEPIPGASALPSWGLGKEAGATFAACPANMQEVEGDYCPYIEQRCIRWIDPETKLRCAEFAPSAKCHMATQHKHFCIDSFEWPNRQGAIPIFMASWREAKTACEGIGKRLCDDSEWTLACEGPEHVPYPYGLKRDSEACNIDKPYGFPDPIKVYAADTQAAELARLDEREPAGSRAKCVSPYGVRDMAGNVDEWVVNETQHGFPYRSGLKGGYWGPVRTRCRPMTTAHEETFRYYQIGFRCCA